MLLRSSSTPVLKSQLPFCSDNPGGTHRHENPPPPNHPGHGIFSFHHAAFLNLSSFTRSSSPISPSITSHPPFRRVRSEGNLEGLTSDSHTSFDEHGDVKPCPRPSRRPSCPVLQTIPSFSSLSQYGKEEEEEDEVSDIDDVQNGGREGAEENGGLVEKSVVQVDNQKHCSIPVTDRTNGFQMYLAKGLGVDGGGGGDSTPPELVKGGGDEDGAQMESYYKKLVGENPGNPLFLRNYAEFLHHRKRDPARAEEYYCRAMLADPCDGEIMSQYARLSWELHGDENKASSYFELAVKAAPEDSHVHAAYASFLWEVEGDEEDSVAQRGDHEAAADGIPVYLNRTMARASA